MYKIGRKYYVQEWQQFAEITALDENGQPAELKVIDPESGQPKWITVTGKVITLIARLWTVLQPILKFILR